MLPPAAYTSAAVFAWEREHFFGGGWTCAGHASQLPAAGDQIAVGTGAGGALIVRGDDRTLRAFANTCRHRGHELLPCGGTGEPPSAIICPYHSWAYDLDGRAARRARVHGPHDFDQPSVDCASCRRPSGTGWCSSTARAARPGRCRSADLDELVAPYEPERLVVGRHARVRRRGQLEDHQRELPRVLPLPHDPPGAVQVSPADSGANYETAGAWVGGWMDAARGRRDDVARRAQRRRAAARAVGERRRGGIYVGIFPNLLVSLHPDYVMTHRLRPAGRRPDVGRVLVVLRPRGRRAQGFDPAYAVDFWDITNRQDWMACESVQRGLSIAVGRAGAAVAR